MKRAVDQNIIERLQKQILALQGNQKQSEELGTLGLGSMESAFPGKVFPRGAVHELLSLNSESQSSTNGFIAVVIGKLMQQGGCCIWISTRRKLFPPALKSFGVDPERMLFVDAWRLKDALWTIEEALKCTAVTAVVGEVSELSFNDSRRLQLAVEQSKVTGFIHRNMPRQTNTVACVTRWKISPVISKLSDLIPGVGFPRWDVQLLKVRNGKPGNWVIQYSEKGIEYISENTSTKLYERKTA